MTGIDPIGFNYGEDARMGGVDIVISLTPSQAKAIGAEAGTMADWFHSALWAMAMLRTGRNSAGDPYFAGPADWYTPINDLDNRLIRRLEGIRDAVVRSHARSGGTVQDLALAMDVSRSTAQYRREALLAAMPSTWERWAEDGGPDDKGRIEDPYKPGTPVADGDFVIGQKVRIVGVSGPLTDRTDLIGKTGRVVTGWDDGTVIVRGLSGKDREEYADFLGFEPHELLDAERR
ncbi:hypothetical protein [Streptomyces ipomoeae]|uniref:hypothetical protein n=1 Tax=Streptomyces ipomoeae TaxID=103232 RepID=UPI0029A1E5B2|nr:hypothetical protein [Streptomyces ipomoeae]MDX2695946.1 hypothetical protein [Streptomyces ipomoeae]MDX2843372.1 hypothetical protein [Streptomyces ipomoeae]